MATILLFLIGLLLTIPTTEKTIEFMGEEETYEVHTFGYIGYFIMGISWLPLLFLFYRKFVPSLAKTYGESLGRGISQGAIIGKRICPKCNLINDSTAKFCNDCGERLVK